MTLTDQRDAAVKAFGKWLEAYTAFQVSEGIYRALAPTWTCQQREDHRVAMEVVWKLVMKRDKAVRSATNRLSRAAVEEGKVQALEYKEEHDGER